MSLASTERIPNRSEFLSAFKNIQKCLQNTQKLVSGILGEMWESVYQSHIKVVDLPYGSFVLIGMYSTLIGGIVAYNNDPIMGANIGAVTFMGLGLPCIIHEFLGGKNFTEQK